MKIEVVEYQTSYVVKTIDCEDKNERQVSQIDSGLNMNMNHDEFFTRIVD